MACPGRVRWFELASIATASTRGVPRPCLQSCQDRAATVPTATVSERGVPKPFLRRLGDVPGGEAPALAQFAATRNGMRREYGDSYFAPDVLSASPSGVHVMSTR